MIILYFQFSLTKKLGLVIKGNVSKRINALFGCAREHYKFLDWVSFKYNGGAQKAFVVQTNKVDRMFTIS